MTSTDTDVTRLRWFDLLALAFLIWGGVGAGIRSAGVYQDLWLIPYKVGKPIGFFLVLGHLLLKSRLVTKRLIVGYLLIGLIAFANGLFRQRDLYFIAADTFLLTYGPVWFVIASSTPASRPQYERIVRLVSWSALFLYLGAILVTYTILIGRRNFYLGFACIPLIVSFAFFASKPSRPLLATLTVLLIFLSGKRGVLVGALAIPALRLFRRPDRPFLAQMGRVVVVAGLLLFAVLFVFEHLQSSNDPDQLYSRSLSKWSLLSTSSDREHLDVGSGGRIAEVSSAFAAFNAQPFNYLAGAGFGFSYTLLSDKDGVPITEDYRYVHLSYVWLFVLYGPFLSPILLLLVGLELRDGLRLRRGVEANYDFALLAGVIGMLIFAFSAASFLVDEFLWYALGLYRNPASANTSIGSGATDLTSTTGPSRASGGTK